MSQGNKMSSAALQCLSVQAYMDALVRQYVPVEGEAAITVYVKRINGKRIKLSAYPASTIRQLKSIIGNHLKVRGTYFI